jgi:thiamine biosynthesis lipoprotein
VTIASDSPVLADAVAKGVFILGPEKGMALIERLPNLEGVIVSAQNDVLVSSGLKEKFVLIARPTNRP